MGSEFTFYDYIDADGSGINVISEWLNGEGIDAKMGFSVMIPNLESSPPPGFQGSRWVVSNTKLMKGDWKGFRELRKEAKGVQYRLIGQMVGRSVFLVACAIHKGQNYIPTISPQMALNRVNQMKSNLARYGREHEYN